MAACARGARIASTVMCSEMDPCSGCSACTVTSTGGGASFLQAGRKTSENAAALVSRQRTANAGYAAAEADCKFVFGCGSVASVIGLHRSGQGLQIGQGRLVAHAAIF